MVITDTAGRRDVLHDVISGNKLMIRFAGNCLDQSDNKRVIDWTERIKKMGSYGVKELYFFIHQNQEYLSLDLVKRMIPVLNENENIKLKVPFDFSDQQTSLNLLLKIKATSEFTDSF